MANQKRYSRWGRRPESEPAGGTFPKLLLIESPRLSLPANSLPHRQIRHFRNASAPARNNGQAGGRLVRGICIPYDVVIGVEGGAELYQAGCFKASLEGDDPLVVLNNNVGEVLGRKSAGTARFSESRAGLQFDCDVPETSFGDDLLVSMRRGDIDGADAIFYIENFSMKLIDGRNIRIIDRAKLIAAAVATFPTLAICNSETAASIASARASGFEAGKRAGATQRALSPSNRVHAEYQRRIDSVK